MIKYKSLNCRNSLGLNDPTVYCGHSEIRGYILDNPRLINYLGRSDPTSLLPSQVAAAEGGGNEKLSGRKGPTKKPCCPENVAEDKTFASFFFRPMPER
jgi:hypothetical protein